MGTAIKHPVVPDRVKTYVICNFWHPGNLTLMAHGWASECPDVKKYKWRLNPVWHRMLYNCTHMATVGVKGLMCQHCVWGVFYQQRNLLTNLMYYTEPGVCYDESGLCRQYAQEGRCTSAAVHQYANYCKHSCRLCGTLLAPQLFIRHSKRCLFTHWWTINNTQKLVPTSAGIHCRVYLLEIFSFVLARTANRPNLNLYTTFAYSSCSANLEGISKFRMQE